MANRISSPLTVFRFSWWHFSEAVIGQSALQTLRFGLGLEHTFASDEGDELAHTFLHALFGFLCDFGIFWKSSLHDPGNWCKVTNVSVRFMIILVSGFGSVRRRLWRWRRQGVGHDRACDRSGTTTSSSVCALGSVTGQSSSMRV